MKIIHKVTSSVSTVYIGYTSHDHLVEFVESIPTKNTKDKWVVIISSLIGCPVGCKMCDAGFFYNGKLSVDELLEQVEYAIRDKWQGIPDTRKFKVQFARMGEPAFNMDVIEAITWIKGKYENFFPSISTVAPRGTDAFFEKLLKTKKELFPYNFQMQFSIHSTNPAQRDKIIPIKKWSFDEIAYYGKEFFDEGGLKITLNFALARENEADADVIRKYFDKDIFLIKITPINPTVNATKNNLHNDIDLQTGLPLYHRDFVDKLRAYGYDVILSVGDIEENLVGSNCGQYVLRFVNEKELDVKGGYEYIKRLGIAL